MLTSLPVPQPLVAPPEHRRGGDQTFLTFPEWFLVYSPASTPRSSKERPPSEFPFWGHIGQFWQSYGAVYRRDPARYPFNSEYHVMIAVIGASTTVEYALRSAYETIVGRVSEATAACGRPRKTAWARASRRTTWTSSACALVRVRLPAPERLWTTTDYLGPGLLRKWERKYALTTEYLVKAVYGWLIGQGTAAGYGGR